MAKQDYILKKYVSADSAKGALLLDRKTKVSEVFLVNGKPERAQLAPLVGFQVVHPEED